MENLTINLIGAFAIVILGLVIARILSNVSRKVIQELETERIFKKINAAISLKRDIPFVIKLIIYFITLKLAIGQLGITASAIKTIILVIVIMLVLLIIFAFKDIFPNLISGILIKKRKTLRIQDTINIMNIKGNITKVRLLETEIITKEGDIIHIPNSLLEKWY